MVLCVSILQHFRLLTELTEAHDREVANIYLCVFPSIKGNQNSAESGVAPARKLTKIDATIICKPHAHPHIMKKTYTKFQKCKRSCAHNKHPLSIYSG